MKTTKLNLALLAAGVLASAASAQAEFIVNGDFESGDIDFTTGYTSVTGSPGPSSMYPEGTYAVGTDPQDFHNLFHSFDDHTKGDGTGKMMIVNGATSSGVNVWTGELSPDLTVSSTYVFSAWVANVYPDSPASLKFSIDGNQIGSDFSATGVGVWKQFTATFTVTAGTTPTAVDLITIAGGNDFALDDISITVVPEPSTYVAGGLALLPLLFGLRSRLLKK